tara:strand:- start:234 stop:479 length:246 start_codon:yes stop_codon:yes gene_type:complete
MEIFLVVSIIILAIFLVLRKVFYSAKRNLFRDQATWSGKDLIIKYNNSDKISEPKENNNYLKTIAEESKFFLEDQLKQEEE